MADIRLIADYTGDEVTAERAEWAAAQAAAFVTAMQKEFLQQT